MVDQPIWLKFVQAYFVFGDKVCPVEKALNDCTDGTAFGQTFVASPRGFWPHRVGRKSLLYGLWVAG